MQMPDMVKVLERFCFKDSEELSTIGKEDVIGPLEMVEPAMEEDHREAEVIDEPIQLRCSRRLAEQWKKRGASALTAMDVCVRASHKNGGGECEEFK